MKAFLNNVTSDDIIELDYMEDSYRKGPSQGLIVVCTTFHILRRTVAILGQQGFYYYRVN